MNLIDILLCIVILSSMIHGWRYGFITGFLELVVWLGSLWAGLSFYPYIANFLEENFDSLGVWTMPLSFLIVVILFRILFGAIVSRLIRSIPRTVHTSGVNKFFGLAPGLINGLIWAALISTLLLVLPAMPEATRNSVIANNLTNQVAWLEEKFSPVFDDAINRGINQLTVEPSSEKSIKLPYTDTSVEIRPDLEKKMLDMVNKERVEHGLPALEADPELTKVARKHSRDMFARGYFSHVNPEGKTPSDRIRADGVRFITAGENLALARTLPLAHTGLMNSPGHRANILSNRYGRVGIGIVDGGIHGLMVTQNFRN